MIKLKVENSFTADIAKKELGKNGFTIIKDLPEVVVKGHKYSVKSYSNDPFSFKKKCQILLACIFSLGIVLLCSKEMRDNIKIMKRTRVIHLLERNSRDNNTFNYELTKRNGLSLSSIFINVPRNNPLLSDPVTNFPNMFVQFIK